jgi:hypothetical protein
LAQAIIDLIDSRLSRRNVVQRVQQREIMNRPVVANRVDAYARLSTGGITSAFDSKKRTWIQAKQMSAIDSKAKWRVTQ